MKETKDVDELKDYEVEIVETLTKTVPVKAMDPADALATVRKLYMNDVIELTADDLIDIGFTLME